MNKFREAMDALFDLVPARRDNYEERLANGHPRGAYEFTRLQAEDHY